MNNYCTLNILSRLFVIEFQKNEENSDALWVIGSLLVSGLLNFAQSVVSFTVLKLVSPLSYSVCTAAKRILVIAVSLLVLKNPVTILNIYGMIIAILGVLFYKKVSLDTQIISICYLSLFRCLERLGV